MNFSYFAEVRDVVGDKKISKPRPRNYTDNDIIYQVIIEGIELTLRKSSVPSSFWKIFKYTLDGVEEKCIFIPDHSYLISCIRFRDVEALLVCKEWLEYLDPESLKDYYQHVVIPSVDHGITGDTDPELLAAIPTSLRRNHMIQRFQDEVNDETILCDLGNYNPVVAAIYIKQIVADNPSIKIECIDTFSYTVAKLAGADVSIIINRNSDPQIINTAIENPPEVGCLDIDDDCAIFDYFLDRVDRQYYDHIRQMYSHDDENKERIWHLMFSCFAEYKSIDNMPADVIEKLIRLTDLNEPYEFQKSIIRHLSNQGPIFSRSKVFSLLFPEIPTTIEHDGDVYPEFFTPSTVGYSKQDYFLWLSESYNPYIMDLYELYHIGFITAKDIEESGLHYVYAICDWIVNRVSRTKGCKA